jgi:predicted DNA-binding ArsR family transcriptional regulator
VERLVDDNKHLVSLFRRLDRRLVRALTDVLFVTSFTTCQFVHNSRNMGSGSLLPLDKTQQLGSNTERNSGESFSELSDLIENKFRHQLIFA